MIPYKKRLILILTALLFATQAQAQTVCNYTDTDYAPQSCFSLGSNATIVTALGSRFKSNSGTNALSMTSGFSHVDALLENITATLTNPSTSTRLLHIYAGNGSNGRGKIQFKGINQLTNSGLLGDAAIYIDATKNTAQVELLANSKLSITQNSEQDFTGMLSNINAGAEGIYLTGIVLNTLNGVAASTLTVPATAELNIAAKGTSVLLDANAGAQAIRVPLTAHIFSTNSSLSTLTRTTGGPMVGTILAQTTVGNRAQIDIQSNAHLDFQSLDLTAAARGASIVANHLGTSVPTTDSAVNVVVGGKQTSTGYAVAAIRAIARSGKVNIEATAANRIHATGNNTDGIYVGDIGAAINPSEVTVDNQGLIEVIGVSGSIDNHGVAILSHDSPIALSNAGDIYLREQSKGFALQATYSPQTPRDITVTNTGVLAFEGTGAEMGGIDVLGNFLGTAYINNSGTIYANKEALLLDTAQSNVTNTGTIVSYVRSLGANATVTNAGTWIAVDLLNASNANFTFAAGAGTNHFNNTGLLTIPGSSAANAISITPPTSLLTPIANSLTVSDSNADTTVTFNLGNTGLFNFGGIVDLQNSTPTTLHYKPFIINGNLQTNSGELKLDTRIAGDDAAGVHTDFLDIQGNITHTAPVTLKLRNTDGVAAPTTTGIELVNITGTSPGTEFVLGDANADGFITTAAPNLPYRLLRRPLASVGSVTGAKWLLANVNCRVNPVNSVAGQAVTINCTGLDDTETLNMPFLSAPVCTYSYTTDKNISPATATCTGTVKITPDPPTIKILPDPGSTKPSIVMPTIPFGAGDTPIPALNLLALLGLLGLLPVLAARRRA